MQEEPEEPEEPKGTAFEEVPLVTRQVFPARRVHPSRHRYLSLSLSLFVSLPAYYNLHCEMTVRRQLAGDEDVWIRADARSSL